MLTRGLCRTEQRDTKWSFSGYATAHANENTVRPRGYYRACLSCRNIVLTLADVDDAVSLCKAIMADWLRKAGGASDKVDSENVTGELLAHLWKLYNRWVPGGLTFTSYSTGILRKKIHTFVAIDVGDPTEPGRGTKAHSRTTSQSYEGMADGVEQGSRLRIERGGKATRGGLDYALGSVSMDPTGDSVAGRSWLHARGDRDGAGFDDRGSVETDGATTTRA